MKVLLLLISLYYTATVYADELVCDKGEIKLQSNDDYEICVEWYLAAYSKLVNNYFPDGLDESYESNEAFPLPNVDIATLEVIISWLKEHYEWAKVNKESDYYYEELEDKEKEYEKIIHTPLEKDLDFFKDLQPADLISVFVAADYLNIQPLYEALSRVIAELISGTRIDEMRAFFGTPFDFTENEIKIVAENPEEYQAYEEDHQWVEAVEKYKQTVQEIKS